MNSNRNDIKQILLFFAITICITTAVFIWMFSGARNNTIAVIIMMYTPGISAIITSLIFKDKIGNYGWKPGKLKYLIYAFIFPLVVSITVYGLAWLSGIAEFTTKEVINYKWAKMLGFELPTHFIIGILSKMTLGFILTCVPVFGEELGWSGFLTPKLLKIFSVPTTSVIVGIFWAVWHYPAIIGGFYGYGTPLWIALPGFTLVLIGDSFVRSVLISKSKSLWTGVVLHASGNIILMGIFYELTLHKEYTAYIVSETGIFTGIICFLIALLFLKMQNKISYNPEV